MVPEQTVPHEPQLFRSKFRFTHALAFMQNVSPVLQVQTPLLQVRPPVHALLHAPQCDGLLFKNTHWLPHTTCPAWGQLHTPATHWKRGGLQTLLQLPQLSRSVWRFRQMPPQNALPDVQ